MPEAPDKTRHARRLAAYERLVAARPEVERKGATVPYTALNGHMFSQLVEDGRMALRLPEGPREAFLKRHKTKLCEQYGVVRKEYVMVPDALLDDTAQLLESFDQSIAYVRSLKPKPTTRKKKA